MKWVFLTILGVFFLTSCGEMIPKSDSSPQPPHPDLEPRLEEPAPPSNPAYSESCSDMRERAELENAEANVYEIWLACLIKNHPEQMRPTMSYHPLLGEVARMRAEDLALNGIDWVNHTDSHGYGPNYYICLAEYGATFCPVYSSEDNSVESLGHGQETVRAILESWLNSPGHRLHVLAEHEYFSEQLHYGIGHAYVSYPPDYDYGAHAWVFIAVHPPLDGTTN